MYNFDDVMNKLDDMESKIDKLLEQSYEYDYYSTYTNTINGAEYRAEVCQRNDGVVTPSTVLVFPLSVYMMANTFLFQCPLKNVCSVSFVPFVVRECCQSLNVCIVMSILMCLIIGNIIEYGVDSY